MLGPTGVGIAGVIDQTAQIALQLGSLNIPTAALRFLAIAQDEQGREGFAWLYRTLVRAILSAAGVVCAIWIAVYVMWPGAIDGQLAGVLAAVVFALAAVPLTAVTNLLRNVLSTLHMFRVAAIVLMASSALMAVATYVGLRLWSLNGAYAAALLVALSTALVLQVQVRTALGAVESARGGSLVALLRAHPDIVRFSLTLYVVGILVPIMYGLVRWRVLGSLGAQDAGFLAAAYTIAFGVRTVFTQASTQYLVPLTSRSISKNERMLEAGKYLRMLSFLMLGAMLLALFPHEILILLYSHKFTDAASVLGLFVLAEVTMAVSDAYRMLQLGFNDVVAYIMTTVSGVVIVIAGVWWVVPSFGLLGVALLQVGAALLVLAQSVDSIRVRHGLPVERRTALMVLYLLASLSLAIVAGREVPRGVGGAAMKVALGAALLLGAWLLFPAAERAATLRSFVRRRSGSVDAPTDPAA